MAELVSGIAKLNPFSNKSVDDEDKGEAIDEGTVAGGAHASREPHITKDQLRVSKGLQHYIIENDILHRPESGSEAEWVSALREMLSRNHVNVPRELLDRNHPLPEYFISSSHNTYLLAHQLYGESHAQAYEIALHTGSRCVEIDAWDNDDNADEPKVTHGYTLVSHIPFREVCKTIRDVVDKEAANEADAAPILISLENHCGAHGQLRLVQIFQEVLGHRLLSQEVRDKGTREQNDPAKHEHVSLAELRNKVAVIVEYHLPNEPETSSSSSSSSSSDDEEHKQAHQAYLEQKKTAPTGTIIPELANLGVYAQSVKPVNNSWFEGDLENAPHHQLINVSESGLKSHLPTNGAKIARHNAHHLMRVYPKGTRISSKNLAPVPFWSIGAQICALNWQNFGASSQINQALFTGSSGYLLKPAALRAGGSGNLGTGRRKQLRLHVAGATDIPLPKTRDPNEIKPYLTCTLVHPNDLNNMPPKRKTAVYKPHKLTGFMHRDNPPATEPLWKEVLEWEYEDNEMVFLRMLIKSDDNFSKNPLFAVAAVRLMYVVPGWVFVRMFDLAGHETACTIFVKFEFLDI